MKYVVDASVLLLVGRGDWLKIQKLGWYPKRDVAVPEPVVVYTRIEVRNIPKASAVERWSKLVAEMPRVPWTTAVTEKVLGLEPPGGLAVDLDAITAAHALANGAAVLTVEPARYEWLPALSVEEL